METTHVRIATIILEHMRGNHAWRWLDIGHVDMALTDAEACVGALTTDQRDAAIDALLGKLRAAVRAAEVAHQQIEVES